MREILFRGKTIDRDWTYGYYVFTPKRTGMFGQTISEADFDKHYILTMKYNLVKEIIPETVGQYTGLTDKNGKKIFEGDIVAIEHIIRTTFWIEIPETHKPRRSYDCHWNEKEDELLYKRNYAVEWKAKDARWILRNGIDQHDLRDVFLMFFHKGIVIGNIHDNPELLKGGGEG